MIEIVRVKRECAKQLASELVSLQLASRLGFVNLLSQTQKYNRFSNNGIHMETLVFRKGCYETE